MHPRGNRDDEINNPFWKEEKKKAQSPGQSSGYWSKKYVVKYVVNILLVLLHAVNLKIA